MNIKFLQLCYRSESFCRFASNFAVIVLKRLDQWLYSSGVPDFAEILCCFASNFDILILETLDQWFYSSSIIELSKTLEVASICIRNNIIFPLCYRYCSESLCRFASNKAIVILEGLD